MTAVFLPLPARFRCAGVLAVLAGLAAVFAACGGGGGPATGFDKVTPAGRALSISDFLAAGFKQSKEYDVTGLPGAVGAFYGFWTPGGSETVEYEIRFYASHQDAVDRGTALAEEVTGRDAVVTEEESTWKEGVRDRRTSGFTFGGGGGSLGVKYGDFIIYGNAVMLCQGRDSVQSLTRCRQLIEAVVGKV